MNRQQRRAAQRSGAGSSVRPEAPAGATPADLFAAAVTSHRAGALAEAEKHYRRVIELAPNHSDSLHNLGLIALDQSHADRAIELIEAAIAARPDVAEYHYNIALAWRALGSADKVASHLERAVLLRPDHALAQLNLGNVRRKQSRTAEALACYERAIAIAPSLASAHFNRANILLEQRRFDETIQAYRQALSAEPRYPEAHAALARTLAAQGKYADAVHHYVQALNLQPNLPDAHVGLCKAYSAIGEIGRAVQAAERAVTLDENAETRQLFAQCTRLVQFTSENESLRKLLLRALREGWGRPRDLAGVCISAIKLKSDVKDLIARVNSAWPERLPPEEMLDLAEPALTHDPMLCELLNSDLLVDRDLELIFTNLRHAMLACHDNRERSEALLSFYCDVAGQCFNNQFIFAMTAAEAAQANDLRAALDTALTDGQPVPAIWPVVVAAYSPLHKLAKREALLARAWPEPVRNLIVRHVAEPLEEHRIATTIPTLTAIGGEVSQAVRQLYEENPYPRWIQAGPPVQPTILADTPQTPVHDILIAGCGTGLSAVELARHAVDARILAIDLSLASLGYAKRMAQKIGIANVEFAQADITQLGSMSRTFDFVDASGVLHHLADPWNGWSLLLARLRSGGIMQVGLYSELARQNVVAARALIAARGYPSTPDGIRACRQDITASQDPLLKSLLQWSDFYSMDECRDLLFHVQEHRVSLPQIKSFVATHNVRLAGFFMPNTAIQQRFRSRFPDDSALLDLDRWHDFETESPDTFAGMYQFWVRKA